MDDLFEGAEQAPSPAAPLADRMRPRSLDEFAGQASAVGEGAPLRQAILQGEPGSLILWGPPGTGKTTLARLIAAHSKAHFTPLSAVSAGIKDVKEVVEAARARLRQGRRTLLFLDECHRFNKAQQDAFLPTVEDGTITFVGATTENPSFELNAALLSRARVIRLEALAEAELLGILRRALADETRGLGAWRLEAASGSLEAIASLSGGDARRALTLLELAAALARAQGAPLETALVERAAGSKTLLYDKSGDQHYDLISALHKSVRSSDPDAAVYWAVRMLASGEDPLYLCRRLARMASEDIGNADPAALGLAMDTKEAYGLLGSPEGELAIIQLAAYLACVPKSDAAYRAYNDAKAELERSGALPVPLHLRNAPTKLLDQLGHGQGYQHAHAQADAVVDQLCLPEKLKGRRFYEPLARGREKTLKEYLEWMEARRQEKRKPGG